ncbi:hypothetical protein V8E36_000383 [Tilletia maclaganii]
MPRASVRSRNQAQYGGGDDDDEIEQSQPTQKRARLSMPGPSQANGAGSSSQRKGKGRASNGGDDNGDSDDSDEDGNREDEGPLTVSDIRARTKNTPLSMRLAKPKLSLHVTEYESALTKMKHVFEYLGEAALAVEELFEEGETDLIGELDTSVREAVDSNYELGFRLKVLKGMVSSLDQQREVVRPVVIYQETMEKALQRYKDKTSRQKYLKSQDYQTFRSNIWEVHNAGNPMPSLNEVIPAEPGDEAEDEVEDFEQGTVAQNFKCPLTTATLEDPVTSTLCPHSYSRVGIEGYFEQKKREGRPATCPMAGCNMVLSAQTIKPDPNLARRVAIYLRRQASQATQGTQSGAAGKAKKAGATKKEAQEDAIEEDDEGELEDEDFIDLE